MNALQTLVEDLPGGQAQIARDLDITPQFVSQWVTGRRPVPAWAARVMEEKYGVSKHQLRPDVFGDHPVDQAAAG